MSRSPDGIPSRPLRVASVFISMPVGGAEDLALALGDALAPQHAETHFVCLRDLGTLGKSTAAEGQKITLLPVARSRRFSWSGPRKLAAWLREHQIDLVHSHTYHAHAYAVPAARIAGVPVITHHHKTLEKMKWRRAWALGRLMRKADAVLALSAETADALQSRFRLSAERVHALPNAVNSAEFFPASANEKHHLREQLGLPADQTIFVCVASLHPVKNHATLLRAFAASGCSDAILVLVGDGGERENLGSLARELGITDRVRMVGIQRPIAPWLRAADAFVFPSRWEGQSLALLQAIGCGLPVLASRIEGNTAVLGEHHDALFDPENSSEIAALLARVASGHTWRERLVADQNARRLPTWSELVERVAAIYQLLATR